jgi:hypothetical protein
LEGTHRAPGTGGSSLYIPPAASAEGVDDRCGGSFDQIDDVISPKERADFMAGYKAAAGFAVEQLNTARPTIAPGARAPAVRGELA